ncbi:MAG TPA: hypothetical protein DC013_01240 [Ruminococcaceae bacterium]|nr:hypothetical protein [Oscillospiraceae bacterium]HBN81836.1 hypothetical protein [Oscillospiraceae bacterium]
MRKNKSSFQRYMTAAIAFLLAATLFAATVSAVEADTPAPGTQVTAPGASSAENPSSTGQPESQEPGPSSEGGASPPDPEESVPRQESEQPSKKPESAPSSRSRSSSSQKAPAVSVPPPKAVASAPADSRSPTEFNSQDLSGLLSGGTESDIPSTDGFLRETGGDAGSGNGGVSSLLLGGIALILLGAAGIGLFLYRQFWKRKLVPSTETTGPIGKPVYQEFFQKPQGKKISDYYDEPDDNYDEYDQFDRPAKKHANPNRTSPKKAAPGAQPHPPQNNAKRPPAQGQAPKSDGFTDISSGRRHGVDKDGFDWDNFFKNYRK